MNLPMSERPHVLGHLDAAAFLRDYWQKRPLLIRQALPGFESPLDPDELAGLALEDGVESRLVERQNGRYVLEHGPFDTKRFTQLPASDWTLLVQDVEKHLPELAETLDRFDFIPHWRIDDLMISYATRGGGVGPHVDAYDVFLLQAKGRRRWSIAQTFDPAVVPDMDVRVLRHFVAEQEWTLEPGDMLYLPPNVAHDGVALDDDCMTWSIGFRAPSLRDLFSDFAEWLHQRLPEATMYADPDLAPWESGNGKISPSAFARMRRLLRGAMAVDDRTLDRWFGQFMTEPKPWLRSEALEVTPDRKTFRKRVLAGDALLRDARAQLAWSPVDAGAVLFVNGEAWDVACGLEALLEMLCTNRQLTKTLLSECLDNTPDDGGIELLRRLHADGVLHFASSIDAHGDGRD